MYNGYCAGDAGQDTSKKKRSRGLFSSIYCCKDFPEESVEAKLKRILQSIADERREGAYMNGFVPI